MTPRSRLPVLAIVLIALLLPACNTISEIGKSEEAASYIMYWHLRDENNEPVDPELVVLDATGQELRRIPWADSEDGGSLAILDSPSPDQALLFDTSDPGLALVNVASGQVQTLSLPRRLEDAVLPLGFLGQAAGPWLAVGSSRGNQTLLVNTSSRQVVDLQALDPAVGLIFSGLFSPTGDYFLAGGSDFWLIPTANPSSLRRLGPGNAVAGNFASGGGSFVFSRVPEPGQGFEIVVTNLNDLTEQVVLTADRLVMPLFIPTTDRLLVLREAEVEIMATDGTIEQSLGTGASCYPVFFGPAGESAVCGVDEGWVFLDLAAGQVTALPELDGYDPRSGYRPDENRWLMFIDEDSRRLVSLDMANGEVTELLANAEGAMLPSYVTVSADGRYAVAPVSGSGNANGQMWLLDASNGEQTLLRETTLPGGMPSFVPRAVFAPDGCCLIVTDQEGMTLVHLDSGEETPLGRGSFAAWIR